MQVILHIGTDKTGSTSIQSALSENRQWLLEHSVFLPVTGLGQDNGHAALLISLESAKLDRLGGELAAASTAGYRVALLSWEGMVRYRPAQIRRLSGTLRDYDVRILVYLREQAEIMQSAHLQWLKMSNRALAIGTLAQPTTVGQHIVQQIFLRDPRRDYYRTLRRWEKGMPQAQFMVREFDHKLLVGGDIVDDLLSVLNLRRDAKFSSHGELVNPSLDVEGALLIERWRMDPNYRERLPTLIDVTQSVTNRDGPQTRHFLSAAAVRTVRRHFRRSNGRLGARFMPGEPAPFRNPRDCWRTESLDRIRQRAQALSDRVREVNCVPTLWSGASGAEVARAAHFYTGWGEVEGWGLWSLGESSALRFRIPCRGLAGSRTRIRVHIRGRYHTGLTSSRVTVNDEHSGMLDLSAGDDIILPVESLLPCEVLDITLEHDRSGALPGPGRDDRPLSFALSSLAVTLSR